MRKGIPSRRIQNKDTFMRHLPLSVAVILLSASAAQAQERVTITADAGRGDGGAAAGAILRRGIDLGTLLKKIAWETMQAEPLSGLK